jgi:hypothetical protein
MGIELAHNASITVTCRSSSAAMAQTRVEWQAFGGITSSRKTMKTRA